MATFKQVESKLRNAAKNVRQNGSVVVRKVALAIDQALVMSTPVDTGRARANWQVDQLEPSKTTIEFGTSSKEVDVVARGAAAGDFAIKAAIAKTRGFNGSVLYITNNLPYIIPLNNGHSQQAPLGFIEAAILNGIRAVRDVQMLEPPKGES